MNKKNPSHHQDNIRTAYRILYSQENEILSLIISQRENNYFSWFSPCNWASPYSLSEIKPQKISSSDTKNDRGIHNFIYDQKKWINSIIQISTPDSIKITSHKHGLLPISQWAFILFNCHKTCSSEEVISTLSSWTFFYKALLIEKNSIFLLGSSLWELILYWHHFRNAARVQLLLPRLKASQIISPHPDICQKARQDMQNFEEKLGWRDWLAWKRILKIPSQKP